MMKKILMVLFLSLLAFSSGEARKKLPVYKDPSRPIEQRVEDLLSRMTLEEKMWQTNQYPVGINDNANNVLDVVRSIPAELGSILYLNTTAKVRNELQKRAMEDTRLGIPMIFGYDVIHGFCTIYPISLAQACSWNTDLVTQACSVAAQEARMSGVDWTFSPMIDVARDPRWGRVAEGYGEDPYTNARFAVASVEGYQGDDMSDQTKIAACLKHFVGYGASEAGRDYVYTEVSRQTLWDTYMPPYEAAVKAGAATLMSCFNDISGVPGTANHYVLTEVLKEKWGHDGFVVSDWAAIRQLITQGLAEDKKEATLKAFNAGVEIDMANGCNDTYLVELVKEGKVSEKRLDDAVRRILRIKFRLGLFEHPYIEETTGEERFLRKESLQVAEKLAEESMVLLKNSDNILPLKSPKKIAVVGVMAQEKWDMLGSWPGHGHGIHVTSIHEGIQKEFTEGTEILYARGCEAEGNDRSKFQEAKDVASQADVVLVCLGEKKQWSGENASRALISLPEIQEEFLKEIASCGKPVVLLLTNGRPLELRRVEPYCSAIVEMWQPGLAAGTAVAGILSGRVNPSGKLAMTFPYSTGQIPVYYNRRQSARLDQGFYQDIPSEPFYPFGYGLSYSKFEYGEPRLVADSELIDAKTKFSVEVDVRNVSDVDGYETVHWYITDPFCSITRPVRELKYFDKQMIRAGETKTFRFEVEPQRDLSFIDSNGDHFLESGEYIISVVDKKIKIRIK